MSELIKAYINELDLVYDQIEILWQKQIRLKMKIIFVLLI